MPKATVLAVLSAVAALAQPAANLTFDVASVKKADMPDPGRPMFMGMSGGPGTADPSQITWSNATLKTLLMTAYNVKAYQVNGPDWIDSERYNVTARVPPGATKDDVRIMWRNLVAERFGVTLHRISKVFQVQEMTVAKSGSKLKETTLDPSIANAPQPDLTPPAGGRLGPQVGDVGVGRGLKGGAVTGGPLDGPKPGAGPFGPPNLDKNGIPQLTRPGLIMMMTMGTSGPTARMVGKAQTTELLANALGNQMNQPVVDKTGLTGKYDFVLEFAPEMNGRGPFGVQGPPPGALPGGAGGGDTVPNAAEPGGATLVAALQQQLGLRLVASRSPLDVLVIDKAEKVPTEN